VQDLDNPIKEDEGSSQRVNPGEGINESTASKKQFEVIEKRLSKINHKLGLEADGVNISFLSMPDKHDPIAKPRRSSASSTRRPPVMP